MYCACKLYHTKTFHLATIAAAVFVCGVSVAGDGSGCNSGKTTMIAGTIVSIQE